MADLALRLIRGASIAPPASHSPQATWRLARLNVEYWQEAVYRAHRAVIESAPGAMLPAVQVWHEAEERLESASLRERRARLQAQGEKWLRVVEVKP